MYRSSLFLLRFVIFLALVKWCAISFAQASSTAPDTQPPLYAYVGTFSSPLTDVLPTQVDLPPGNGKGIHIFRVDRSTGQWTESGLFPLGTSPSHLVINADGTRLYSANETDRVNAASADNNESKDRTSTAKTETQTETPDANRRPKQGTVSAFSIDRQTGQLTMLGTVPSGGAGPTYLSIHPSGKHLLVANYFGGSVAVLPIQEDGTLKNPSDVREPTGVLGPVRATNAPPGSFAISGHDRTHAHMIKPDPLGKHVLHIDLGLDTIFVWKLNESTGKLTPAPFHTVSLPPGDGPRHFDFHPNNRWFYSIQEEGSTVALFDYDATGGTLTHRQTWSTLPPNFAGSNFCSEILVSNDGRFLYAGNRLHDSIAIFQIASDGTLTYLTETWTQGNYPRSFEFDPSGRFLYCCNQRSDNVAAFAVDPKTGLLEFTGQFIPVGNPSCITFLD